jgi:hypothetical protein
VNLDFHSAPALLRVSASRHLFCSALLCSSSRRRHSSADLFASASLAAASSCALSLSAASFSAACCLAAPSSACCWAVNRSRAFSSLYRLVRSSTAAARYSASASFTFLKRSFAPLVRSAHAHFAACHKRSSARSTSSALALWACLVSSAVRSRSRAHLRRICSCSFVLSHHASTAPNPRGIAATGVVDSDRRHHNLLGWRHSQGSRMLLGSVTWISFRIFVYRMLHSFTIQNSAVFTTLP